MKKKIGFLIIFVVAIFTCKSSLADCRGGQFWLCFDEARYEINHGNMDKAQELFTIGCRGGEAYNCIYRDNYAIMGVSPYKMLMVEYGLMSVESLSKSEYEISRCISNIDWIADELGGYYKEAEKIHDVYYKVLPMISAYKDNKGFKGWMDRNFGSWREWWVVLWDFTRI